MKKLQELKEIRNSLSKLLKRIEALIEEEEKPKIQIAMNCPYRKMHPAKCIAKNDFAPRDKCALVCPVLGVILGVEKYENDHR